jgi:hypothetical protein
MSLFDMLQTKVDELSKELEKADEKLVKYQTEREALRKRRDAFKEALQEEMRERGMYTLLSVTQDQGTNGKRVSTAQFIRDYVLKGNGVTVADIRDALKKENIKAHPNYAYGVLARMLEKDEIDSRRGKYYPPKEKEKGGPLAQPPND